MSKKITETGKDKLFEKELKKKGVTLIEPSINALKLKSPKIAYC